MEDNNNSKLDRIENKVDQVFDRLGEVEGHMGVYNEQLKHHIYRTDLAESNLKMLREEMHPVRDHVKMVALIAKLAIALAGTVAFVAGLVA